MTADEWCMKIIEGPFVKLIHTPLTGRRHRRRWSRMYYCKPYQWGEFQIQEQFKRHCDFGNLLLLKSLHLWIFDRCFYYVRCSHFASNLKQQKCSCYQNLILCNFLFQNKVKGYISHQHQKLVLSKQNPFPPLATVIWQKHVGI